MYEGVCVGVGRRGREREDSSNFTHPILLLLLEINIYTPNLLHYSCAVGGVCGTVVVHLTADQICCIIPVLWGVSVVQW